MIRIFRQAWQKAVKEDGRIDAEGAEVELTKSGMCVRIIDTYMDFGPSYAVDTEAEHYEVLDLIKL